MIPFSPPRIDDEICNEVVAALKSGWITTGPRTKIFEEKITAYCGNNATLCLNSATAGLEMMLRWFGVGEGDEIILPAYTFSATANVIIHCGAKPVFVDVNATDFNINVHEVANAVTRATKAIMPVDFGGMPCDYARLMQLSADHKSTFRAGSDVQRSLGRMLVLSDSAHSFGASLHGRKAGSLCDASVFSFHAVKNLSTAEGGAIALNFDEKIFSNEAIYRHLYIKTLHGQDKDALTKAQKGNWKYDIVEAGYKYNMTDIAAAIGIVELARYEKDTLPKRRHMVTLYNALLGNDPRFERPIFEDASRISNCHLYPLRIKSATEIERDEIITEIFNREVSVNVHYIPLPAMSFYKRLGYEMGDYKVAYDNYSREISLPVFYDLTDEQIKTVVSAVKESVNKIM